MDAALARLDDDFEPIHASISRPSIPPEQLLRALLLQAFYTVRSERQLMQQLDTTCSDGSSASASTDAV